MTSNFPPGTPMWVELGTTDVTAATAFYGELFGWTVEDMGPEAGGYGLIRQGGKQVAGIGPATDPARGTSWAVYFATDDADETAAKVEANGGTVIVAPMDVMDQGRMAVFTDPSGAFFSAWQPAKHRGAELVGEHGSLSWVELYTSDIGTAKGFYPAVLPVTTRDIQVAPDTSYTLLRVGEKDVAGAMQVEGDAQPPHWSVYFAVNDRDATADMAVRLGGTELMRDDVPPGDLAILTDPQGGTFCIIKPNPDFSM